MDLRVAEFAAQYQGPRSRQLEVQLDRRELLGPLRCRREVFLRNRDRSFEMPGSRVLDHGRECSCRHHGRDRIGLAVHPLATADDNRGAPTFENGTSTGVAHLFERFAQHPFRIRQPSQLVAQHAGLVGGDRRPQAIRSRERARFPKRVERVLGAVLVAERGAEHVRGLDLGAGLERGARQPLGDDRLPKP